MKQFHTTVVLAFLILGAQTASAGIDTDTDTVTHDDATVTDTITTALYETTTITWLRDANLAASLTPDSPLWVEGINPDGSMSLSTAVAFINQLNINSYLGINTWRLPTSNLSDTGCSLSSMGGPFGYNCGTPSGTSTQNPGHPYNELAGLFYNVLGGTAGNNILLTHNSNFKLFKNLQPYLYWSETAQTGVSTYAFDFWFQNGFEGTEDEYDSMFVLPVSTTTTGNAPQTAPAACPDYTNPKSCPYPYPSDLGLSTTLPPAKLTLQETIGGLLVYDPALDVTFLANANLAGSLSHDSPYWVSGINPDGSMDLDTLTSFLAALNNPDNPYLGITGWMIPTVMANNPDCSVQTTGENPDYGYNCDTSASQLGELFYDQLSGGAGEGPFFFHLSRPLTPEELRELFELEIFNNLQLNYYWQQCLPGPCNANLLESNGSFSFLSGYQGIQNKNNDLFVFLEVPGHIRFLRNPHPQPPPF
jgi:hypothetical protein